MSLKDSTATAVVQASGQQQLYTKLKSRTSVSASSKEADSPKSVISDPRIVSPASSASASLERRLTDLKKLSRHDRVYSISDVDDEGAQPPAPNIHAVLSRQHSARERERNGLDGYSGAHPLPSVPARVGCASGPSSETSSPRNRIGRSKDSSKYIRGNDEFVFRRLSAAAGADSTSSSGLPTDSGHGNNTITFSMPKSVDFKALNRNHWRNICGIRSRVTPSPEGTALLNAKPLDVNLSVADREELSSLSMYDMLLTSLYGPLEQIVSGKGKVRSGSEPCLKDCSIVQISSGVAFEDQIEFNKFVVRSGSNGDEIRTRELKRALTFRSFKLEGSDLEIGDGRSGVAGYRQRAKSVFSPGESPGHPPAYGEWPRSAQSELSLDVTGKETAKYIKEYPEMPLTQLNGGKMDGSSGDPFDSVASTRPVEGRRKSESHVSSGASLLFPSEGNGQGHVSGNGAHYFHGNGHSEVHYVGKFHDSAMKSALGPQQRLVQGQFLKSNPLDHRPQPAKWDDAEKWLISPAVKSNSRIQQGNNPSSVVSTPHHLLHHQNPAGKQHLPRSCPSGGDSWQRSLESLDTRFPSEHNSATGNAFPSAPESRSHAVDVTSAASSVGSEPPRSSLKPSKGFAGVSSGEKADGVLHAISDVSTVKSSLMVAANKLSREKTEHGSVRSFREAKDDYEKISKSVSGLTRADTSVEIDFEQSDEVLAANIFDSVTKDKFADSITVQSTSSNNGRSVVVMKDAATEITPSTSQRDIATQITPVQSFHAVATPPRVHSGPARLNTTPVHSERRPASMGVDVTELQNCHQAKLQLDQVAVMDTTWTTREEEVEESARSLRLSSVDFKEVKKNVLEARAAAWEEAEQSKYMSRFHREEAKIIAWEAHQKAKAEADMRKVEVKLERMRSHANEILQNKIATVHLKAENMRAAAAAACGEQAAKTNQWAQEIRVNGKSPPSPLLCCFSSCFSS